MSEREPMSGRTAASNFAKRQYKSWERVSGLEVVNIIC